MAYTVQVILETERFKLNGSSIDQFKCLLFVKILQLFVIGSRDKTLYTNSAEILTGSQTASENYQDQKYPT